MAVLHGQPGAAWLAMTAAERTIAATVLEEIRGAGLTLRAVWEGFKAVGKIPGKPIPVGEAYDLFMKQKSGLLLAPKSLSWYRCGPGAFIRGREGVMVSDVTREQVAEWLANPEWGPRTFNARCAGLRIFFNWCCQRQYISVSPVAGVERIPERRMPDLDTAPAILTVDQCQALLRATLTRDKGMVPYVALALFAGLRPEREAARALKTDIADGHVQVRGLNAKDRQRRLVPIHPTLQAWLDLRGGEMPPSNLRRRFERIREAAGLIKTTRERGGKRKDGAKGFHRYRVIESTGWSQDCLRHTFASNYLPVFGVEKTIMALGHGDYDMLFAHYRSLVKIQDAEKFWALVPNSL